VAQWPLPYKGLKSKPIVFLHFRLFPVVINELLYQWPIRKCYSFSFNSVISSLEGKASESRRYLRCTQNRCIHSFRGGATTIVGAVVQLVEYRTRNREVAGSTHTRSTASNLEQVANLLRAQANSASYP